MMTVQNRRAINLLFSVALSAGACFIIVALFGACTDKISDVDSAKPATDHPATHSKNAAADKQRNLLNLVGRWVRTDGGYIIEIRNVAVDGKMDAGYFNPRPINISEAKASQTNTGIRVFMELQDVGYPGSTYTLNYDPAKDALIGFYYQAAMQQNFDVIFARVK